MPAKEPSIKEIIHRKSKGISTATKGDDYSQKTIKHQLVVLPCYVNGVVYMCSLRVIFYYFYDP